MKKTKYICAVAEEQLIINTGNWKKYPFLIDQAKCKHCGVCLMYCPVNAIVKTEQEYSINPAYCKGCGVCRHECPAHAIYEDKGDEKDE